jgi:uncharacterized protein (DUF2147 family)
MLNTLRNWAESQSAAIAARGIHMEITVGSTTVNPAMRLDLDSTQFMGRITYWESGECELEVIDIDTGKTMYSDYQILAVPTDFDNAFRDFLQVLGSFA